MSRFVVLPTNIFHIVYGDFMYLFTGFKLHLKSSATEALTSLHIFWRGEIFMLEKFKGSPFLQAGTLTILHGQMWEKPTLMYFITLWVSLTSLVARLT